MNYINNIDCPICDRNTKPTFHHLIPKCLHKRFRKKKLHRKMDLNGGFECCDDCHTKIHQAFDNKTLANELNSFNKIIETKEIQNWKKFIHKTKKKIF